MSSTLIMVLNADCCWKVWVWNMFQSYDVITSDFTSDFEIVVFQKKYCDHTKMWFWLLMLVPVLVLVLMVVVMSQIDTSYPRPSVHSCLTPKECRQLIRDAEPMFTRSHVLVAGGQSASNVRTSQTAWLPKDHLIAQKVLAKAAALAGVPVEHCENLQIVKYEPGTFYRTHHDACCDGDETCAAFLKRGGQRIGTFLVYLNDEFTDGHTSFPMLNLKMKAPVGSGIFFRPIWPLPRDRNSKSCPIEALHAGLPITTGTKYVCNAWVRHGTFV